jgi:hypothetical protein
VAWPFGPGPRPAAAATLRVPLAVAYGQCLSPNREHSGGLQTISCTPAVPTSSYLTVGVPDANGKAAQFGGSVKYRVECNPPAPNPSPPCTDTGDQADVSLQLSMADIRKRSDLSDYTGEVQVSARVRLTDKSNGSVESDPATVSDVNLQFTVACAATTGVTDIGSTCNATTHADSVMPGLAVENRRAVWELGRIEVYDGGADGVVSTAGNTLFATQGVFVP